MVLSFGEALCTESLLGDGMPARQEPTSIITTLSVVDPAADFCVARLI
jgi:hypothetical protein